MSVLPDTSSSSTGKLASNDQLPGIVPVTVSGLRTCIVGVQLSSVTPTPFGEVNVIVIGFITGGVLSGVDGMTGCGWEVLS